MSLFGYPGRVTHYHHAKDDWGRPLPPTTRVLDAKVVEEQKIIKNARGEEVQVNGEIHLEGAHPISFDDYFMYLNAIGAEVRYDVEHYEIRKFIGTDDVKKVIVYAQ
ncbi:hypothetical protein [Paenibacillus daejeonensis]|uniref:hypothetical protein n=1 Tax=Paenibacillus daejeonensis TaxID=135193 RepID=UPI0003828016|nr:hypothetical protein [Paenibacillus daejeonensis]